MDLGAPEGKVSMETYLLQSLPSALQTPRVGGNLGKFVSVKFENLHAGQIDNQVSLLRTLWPLGTQAWGIETIFQLPSNLAHFLIMVFLGKNKTFLKKS